MTESRFDTPFGSYRLERLPCRRRERLRAWDAADEYLLYHLAEQGKPAPHQGADLQRRLWRAEYRPA